LIHAGAATVVDSLAEILERNPRPA